MRNAMRPWMIAWAVLLAARVAAAAPFELPLWPDGAPGSESSTLEEVTQDREITDGSDARQDRHVAGVTRPSVTIYLPVPNVATGCAVVILPGGGFNILAIDKEGHDVARWLNEHGIAGIVVKYRLPDPEQKVFVRNGALADVQRAIRLTRLNADKWGIAADRIGVAGFSAGGYLTAAAGTMFDGGDARAEEPLDRISCRPDFISPIYPLISLDHPSRRSEERLAKMLGPELNEGLIAQYSPDQRVTSDTPPTFLVHANDDGLSAEHSVLFYLALKKAGVPVEMHVYSSGGHGYGIRQRGLPISSWCDRWLDWMRHSGFAVGHRSERRGQD